MPQDVPWASYEYEPQADGGSRKVPCDDKCAKRVKRKKLYPGLSWEAFGEAVSTGALNDEVAEAERLEQGEQAKCFKEEEVTRDSTYEVEVARDFLCLNSRELSAAVKGKRVPQRFLAKVPSIRVPSEDKPGESTEEPEEDVYLFFDPERPFRRVTVKHKFGVKKQCMKLKGSMHLRKAQALELQKRMIKKQQPGPQKTLKATLKLINGAQFQDLNTYEKAVFIRFYDEVNNPERGHRIITPEGDLADFQRTVKGEKSGTAWNGFGDIQKAVEIIENGARENVDVQLGMMHKVRSFYNNILNPMSDRGDVTIDTHAVAAGHLRPFSGNHQEVMENFKGGGKSGVSGAVGAYGLYADAYRAAAAEAGVLPREMQSITWEAVRGLFTPQYKGQKKNQETIANIWKRYDAGDIMIDQARQEIFDAAGGINRAAWEGTGPDNPTVEQNRSLADPGNLSGTGVPGTGNRRGAGSEPSGPLLRSAQTVKLTGTFDDGDSYAEQEAEALDLQERLSKQQNVARFFEKSKRVVRKAVRRLDPEGRETMSVLAAGLNGKGVTNEDLEVITPLLVDSFATLSTMPPEVFGEYVERKNRETGEVKRSIRLKQIGDETIEDVMTPQQFMNTFLHELGHSIEAQSGFREFLTVLQFVANNSSDQDMMKLHEDVVNISRSRRPELWAGVDFKLQNLQTQTQVVVPDASAIAKMDRNELYQLGLRIDEDFTEQGMISPTGTFMNTLAGIKTDVDYAYNPAELGADVIAAYLYAPAAFKKNYPEVAERVREVVNNSDIKDFITFHSLASILGVGAMAALLAGADDEEEKGVLSLGSGALSAA